MPDPLHRWTALGLAFDLADGKRTVLVLGSRDDIRDAMRQVLALTGALGVSTRTRLTNGDEQITALSSRGRLNFRTPRQVKGGTVRGYTLDVVAFDEAPSLEALEHVMPCVIIGGGELIEQLPHSR
jgi:hypothetical protein